ncbi:hypothetical protein GGU10DRAFT_280265, partial [Lentinula aff. detonsa]
RRIPIMIEAHEKTGHKGIWATNSSIHERFWWPRIIDDVKWFIKTCHICQLRQTEKLRIPPVVAQPLTLFAKCYMDVMEMPKSGGFKYIYRSRSLLIICIPRVSKTPSTNWGSNRKLDF